MAGQRYPEGVRPQPMPVPGLLEKYVALPYLPAPGSPPDSRVTAEHLTCTKRMKKRATFPTGALASQGTPIAGLPFQSERYCLIIVPSIRRTSLHPPFRFSRPGRKGLLAASASSTSMPSLERRWPQVAVLIGGQPLKISASTPRIMPPSWTEVVAARSRCRLQA